MTGDPGPYMDPNGDSIWVPRTVPYLEARQIAKTGMDYYSAKLIYEGKSEARLYGFAPACRFDCDESCHLADNDRDDFDPDLEDACLVPAWHFRQEE